jgi:hypothetical protein
MIDPLCFDYRGFALQRLRVLHIIQIIKMEITNYLIIEYLTIKNGKLDAMLKKIIKQRVLRKKDFFYLQISCDDLTMSSK